MAQEIREVNPKNVMSVELAIRRELAYRKRVGMLLGGSDGMDGLKPLEVPSRNQNSCPSEKIPRSQPQPQPPSSPHSQLKQSIILTPSLNIPPRPLPIPNANPSTPLLYQRSSLYHNARLSGSKRKEPCSGIKRQSDTEEHEDQLHCTNGTPRPDMEKSLFCEICQVHCCGDFNMMQHLQGQKHNVKLVMAKQGMEMKNKRWGCQVCKIYCTSEDLFKLHLQGKKHLQSLHNIKANEKNSSSSPWERI